MTALVIGCPARLNLLIISATPHHRRDGRIVGWGPTVRELDQLATRFTQVRHVAYLDDAPASDTDLPYTARNIELVPVAPAGGDGLLGKLDALRASPSYVVTILRELASADFVHVRAPANIALIAMLLVSARRRPAGRWFKYAGNWRPAGAESLSYSLQRWWLEHRWHQGIVTVNGAWPEQPSWVRTFFNPSLDAETVARGREAAASKHVVDRLVLLYVGRVETPKGAGRAIEIVARLAKRGVSATLHIVGDGEERGTFETAVRDRGLSDRIHFHGWLSPHALLDFYTDAHVSLLPTTASEGWPKVLSEGMAFGVVPVAGAVSSIPQYLTEFGLGAAIPAEQLDRYVDTLAGYIESPATWKRASERAVEAANLFTFTHYLSRVEQLLDDSGR